MGGRGSTSAKSKVSVKKYPVRLLNSKNRVKLADGQSIVGKVFAGKGTEKEIRERYKLEARFHQPAEQWQKVSGIGYVVINGKKVKAELHWYEANGNAVDMKVKRYLDED